MMIQPGDKYSVTYPFILDDGWDEPPAKTWRPGVRFENVSPEDVGAFADGEGQMTLTVVSLHKPGRFPSRVFYTRAWRAPNGKEFGKSRLLIATAQKFKRIAAGYGHEYRLTPPSEGE